MPDRPKHSHYNQDDSANLHRQIGMMKADARHNIDQLRETPRVIFGSWVVRVAIMAAVLGVANYAFGPFGWIWWALLAYAILSLGMNLALSGMKNRQLDQIERIYDQDDARHPR